MKVFKLKAEGSIDNLALLNEPSPVPGPGQVIVKMLAASLNARDLMIVLGPSPYGPKPNLIPLSDGAGEVIAVHKDIKEWNIGDRVVASFRPAWRDGSLEPAMIGSDLGGGADGVLAQQCAFDAAALVRIPENMSYTEAATLPCAGVTAWRALTGGAGLEPDHDVLILGTGGVSLLGLQIAKASGCRVFATTSSSKKEEKLFKLGADAVVNYKQNSDWPSEILSLTGGRGVDRIVEVGGAGSLPQSFKAAAFGAEIGLIGMLDDPTAPVSVLPVMGKMMALRGVSVGSTRDLANLIDFTARNFSPVIDKIFAFADAPNALRHLQSGAHMGKVMIDFG